MGGASRSSKSNVRLAQASIAQFFQRSDAKPKTPIEGGACTHKQASEQPTASEGTHGHESHREAKRQRLDGGHKVAAVNSNIAVQEVSALTSAQAQAPSGGCRPPAGLDLFNGYACNGGLKDAPHAHVKHPLNACPKDDSHSHIKHTQRMHDTAHTSDARAVTGNNGAMTGNNGAMTGNNGAMTGNNGAMNKQHVKDAAQADARVNQRAMDKQNGNESAHTGRAKHGNPAAGVSGRKNTKGRRRSKNAANESAANEEDAIPAEVTSVVDADTANELVGNIDTAIEATPIDPGTVEATVEEVCTHADGLEGKTATCSGDPALSKAIMDEDNRTDASGKSKHSSQEAPTGAGRKITEQDIVGRKITEQDIVGRKITEQDIVLKEEGLLDAGHAEDVRDDERGVNGAVQCSDRAETVQQMAKSESVLAGCSSLVRADAEEDCRDDEGVEYEKQRDERIRKNMEMLASMGLLNMIPSAVPPAPKAGKKAKCAIKPKQAAAATHAQPRRSGLRSQNKTDVVADVDATGTTTGCDELQQAEVEVQYQQSALHNYVCSTCDEFTWSAGNSSSHELGEGREMIAVNEVPGCFSDPSLTRIYSMDVRGELLAAAGKDGRVAVFGIQGIRGNTNDSDAVPPLLSCKLHSGWISDIQFFDSARQSNTTGQTFDQGQTPTSRSGMDERSEQLLMLSAGNDNLLALWDLSQTAVKAGSYKGGNRGLPKLVCSSKTVHSGGIFSMHQTGDVILTASKDTSVAVTRVAPDGSFSLIHQYTSLFNSVVKCCRWRDTYVFAAGGNDRLLALVDTRSPLESPTTCTIPDAHTSPINSLSWSPSDPHLLFSASNDPYIKLWDARNLSNAVYTYQGHAMSAHIKSIYNPVFVGGGSLIATGVEKSSSLTLYCVKTGRTISRGDIGYTPDKLHAFSGGSLLLAARTRSINMLNAVWRLKSD